MVWERFLPRNKALLCRQLTATVKFSMQRQESWCQSGIYWTVCHSRISEIFDLFNCKRWTSSWIQGLTKRSEPERNAQHSFKCRGADAQRRLKEKNIKRKGAHSCCAHLLCNFRYQTINTAQTNDLHRSIQKIVVSITRELRIFRSEGEGSS